MSEMTSIAAVAELVEAGLNSGVYVGDLQGSAVTEEEAPAGEQEIGASAGENGRSADEEAWELWGSAEQRLYRKRATTMLRRYMRYSLETGRLPSLLGREFFASRVTQYRVTTLEERVIFVHDMEKCLGRLDEWSQQVLARIVLQEYEQEEAARLLGCSRITVCRRLVEALDQLVGILLEVGLLEHLPGSCGKSCQEGKGGDFELSASEQSEKKVAKYDTRTFAI